MNTFLRLASAAALVVLTVSNSSCVYDDSFGYSSYGSTYSSPQPTTYPVFAAPHSSGYRQNYAPVGYPTRSVHPPLQTFDRSYSSGIYHGGGPVYQRHATCSRCHASPCRCQSGHSRPLTPSQAKKLGGDFKIVDGNVRRSQTKPQGSHPIEWYQKRGYDLNKLVLKDSHGNVVKGSSDSSRSSAKRSSKKKK